MSDEFDNEPAKPTSQNQPFQQKLSQQQQQQNQVSSGGGSLQSQVQFPFAPLRTPEDFFSSYHPKVPAYDENFDATGNLRPHWTRLGQDLNSMGAVGIERRAKQIKRTVHQNGIAYSAYGDPTVRKHHLQLDTLPQLIPEAEWNTIEAALKQRAELFNLMLADLYGPRTLLTSGVLPPDILFGHPHYQLPYHGLPTSGGKHLHFYAAELIRSPSGDWWVLGDRTDSPAGGGFALENRLLLSRAFPNEFRKHNVARLAQYFIALREHLASCAKNNTENPHIVVLSEGGGSRNYFEDSFLARYLGFALVETNDLVVRSGRVMLKTLPGLAPIDVIWRRQQGNSLDPLELGGDAPGVAGILQVIRDEHVAVVNSPGSGLVESPIFMAFLPHVCQALLKTDLLMPGVATWWGGNPDSLKLIIDRIDEINLMPAFREMSLPGKVPQNRSRIYQELQSIEPENLTREERIAMLRRNPNCWVGQEKVACSTAPVWDNGNFKTGFVSMRTFLTASGNDWRSLPGGLVRVTEKQNQSIRDPFKGLGAKDAWVLAENPVEPVSLLKKKGELLKPTRDNGLLPSRVADNLCWLGRYLERTDFSVRLLRAILKRMTSENDPQDAVELPVLLRTLALSGLIDSGYAIKEFSTRLPPLEDCLPTMARDHQNPNSLRSMVDQIASVASRVRDRLSSDSWRVVQELLSCVKSCCVKSCEPENCDLVDLLDVTDAVVANLAAFSGLVSEAMTRSHAFRFLNIGRRIEHALQIAAFIKHCFAEQAAVPDQLLEAALDIMDSGMTYRARYYANLQLPLVLDLLLVDELNPRSLAFQLVKLKKDVKSLPGNIDAIVQFEDRLLAVELLDLIRTLDLTEVTQIDAAGERPELLRVLEKVEFLLPAISLSLSNHFLVHSGPLSQLIHDDFDVPQ